MDLGKCQCVGRQDVVQALDPNCRVHIQPRFNQSKKIHTYRCGRRRSSELCVCTSQSHTHEKNSQMRMVKLHTHAHVHRYTYVEAENTHSLTQTMTVHHNLQPSAFRSRFPRANKQLIQLKPVFFLYSLSFLLVFINFASLSLSALSIINADILPISSSVPHAIFHRGSVIGGDWPNNNDIYNRYLLSGFVAGLWKPPAENLHAHRYINVYTHTHACAHTHTQPRWGSLIYTGNISRLCPTQIV